MQYEETDWAFCCRLAARLDIPVVTNSQADYPRFSIGLPDAGKRLTIDDGRPYTVEYEAGKHIACIEHDEYYSIGTRVSFLGQNYRITEVIAELRQEVIVFRFRLMFENQIPAPQNVRNQRISGVCLEGKVEKTQRDEIRVRFDIDGKDPKHWFTVAAPYASRKGGIYFMPEKGDRVRVLFPDSEEANAYASGLMGDHAADFRTNPEIRRIRHPDGNEVILAPDYMELRLAGKKSYIRLNNRTGDILLHSARNINFTSGDSVEIDAGNRLIVDAGRGVTLRQADNLVELAQGNVTMRGEHVRIVD